ncbi:MAG: hypothetical protein MJ231_05110, partial [bacterium]|nr:hypothetical protein [bacterium]
MSYIKNNYPKVIKKLKNKKNLKVVFYIYDETKWKCQSLYDLFEKESRFTPLVLVTRNAAKNPDNSSYQSVDDVKRCYDFFENKGMKVDPAYDI